MSNNSPLGFILSNEFNGFKTPAREIDAQEALEYFKVNLRDIDITRTAPELYYECEDNMLYSVVHDNHNGNPDPGYVDTDDIYIHSGIPDIVIRFDKAFEGTGLRLIWGTQYGYRIVK